LPHLASGQEIIPSDFLFLGSIKGEMSDDTCASRPDFLKAIAEIFSQMDKAMLICLFESWIKRLQWVLQNKGEHSLQYGQKYKKILEH
jgi:hypothetical protein